MDNYFNKAVVFADAHFGRSSDSPVPNGDNLEFLDWMIDRARSWGAETCIFLGDYYHNRSSLGIASLDAGLRGLEKLSSNFPRTVMLLGNHDLSRRATRGVASVNFSRHLPNIELICNPVEIAGAAFLPWLIDDEQSLLPQLRSRYVFGHLETIGAMMNAKVVCSGGHHAIEADVFKTPEQVFSGHFHQRQTLKNISYIGNIMPFDFSDANDTARGAMFLQWGRDPFYEQWPDQPLYHTATLSHLLDNLSALRPRMTVRATVDMELRYEETQEIRDALVTQYGLRKIEMINTGAIQIEPDIGPVQLHTVDQIVIDGLRGLETTGMSSERLISIYQELPRS